MSSNTLREDKTCLNCGTFVEERFCPQCGQENTETRKSFHYLFTHFVEDLVHYDSGFWKTLKYLLFHPARLTREYLSGRRMAFVAPVKLYIFISFITFFLTGLFMTNPLKIKTSESNSSSDIAKTIDSISEVNPEQAKQLDSLSNVLEQRQSGFVTDYETVEELDSVQKSLPASKKMGTVEYWFMRKYTEINEHNTPKEIASKFFSSFKQNLPKVLFLFMPVFAFWLWIFHGKKRWLYFDHGIFTLHYFSFLLLSSSLTILLDALLDFFKGDVFTLLKIIVTSSYFIWSIVYFYKAHKRMYGESTFISFLKSTSLFIINWVFIILFIALLSFYSIISIK